MQRWGQGLAVRIPQTLADEMGIGADSVIDLRVEGGRLVARSADSPLVPTLDELLDRVTPENSHPEVDWGPDVGAEIVEY